MTNSALVQPVVSTEAIGKPDLGSSAPKGIDAALSRRFFSYGWQDASRQFRQDVLTSAPLLFADVVSLVTCLYTGALLSMLATGLQTPVGIHKHVVAVGIAYTFFGIQKNLFPANGINPVFELRQQLTSSLLAFVFLLVANGIFGVIAPNEVLAIAFAFPLSALVMPAMRFAARYQSAKRSWWGQRVIIIGAGKDGTAIYRHFERMATRGVRPIGLMDETANQYWADPLPDAPPFLGTLDELESVCEQHKVFKVIAVVSDRGTEETRQIVARCSSVPNIIVLSNRLFLPSLWVGTCDFAGLNGIHIRDRLLCLKATLLKRVTDICLAGVFLMLASPILVAAAIVLKFKSPGPIFYGHRRIGRNGEMFTAWKIRSMVPDADTVLNDYLNANPDAQAEWEQNQKLKLDPRIIPGRLFGFLRKASLDELPQLWNVLRGEMSLVGPRPIVAGEVEKYDNQFPLYVQVKPGLTGLWQVSGRNNTSYEDRVRLDSYYVRNWSMWLDYYILLRTVRTVVWREGAF